MGYTDMQAEGDMNQIREQFRIPKISVPIICQTISQEQIAGEIFIDRLGSSEYASHQITDFFNDQAPFFPLRTSMGARPILLQKTFVVQVEIPGMMNKFLDETASSLAVKKEAVIYRQGLGAVTATVMIDMPEDHSRLLDLLNLGAIFFPAIIDGSFQLVNSRLIFKIEENL